MYYRKSTNPSAFRKQQLRVHKLTFDLTQFKIDDAMAATPTTNFAYLIKKKQNLCTPFT